MGFDVPRAARLQQRFRVYGLGFAVILCMKVSSVRCVATCSHGLTAEGLPTRMKPTDAVPDPLGTVDF